MANLVSSFPLEELSWKITKNASIVSQYLSSNSLPQPSSEARGPGTSVPADAPQHIRQAQQHLVSASLELSHLALGPSEFIPNLAVGFQYASCVAWLCEFNIFRLVPLEQPISYTDLATAAGVPEKRLKSILRTSMTSWLFREHPDDKHVVHSATSALFARDENVHNYASYLCVNVTTKMAPQMAAAHRRWGAGTVEKNETAYNVAFDTDMPFFEHIKVYGNRMAEFAGYMRAVRSSTSLDSKHLVGGYAWEGVPEGGLVVDIGGSTGSVAITLAKAFPHLNFVVQDLPANIESGQAAAFSSEPTEITSRITFQAHDFFQPQPVHGADVYLFRMILHDWNDETSIQILKNVVPVLTKPGARLLIMDTVLPRSGDVPVSVERIVRVRDLTMMQSLNAQERDFEDWKALFANADERLRLVNVVQPFGSEMSVLEVALDSEDSEDAENSIGVAV